jgi:hypothetical protein
MLFLAATACLACAVANGAVASRQTDRQTDTVRSSDEKTYVKYEGIIQETYTDIRKKVNTIWNGTERRQ